MNRLSAPKKRHTPGMPSVWRKMSFKLRKVHTDFGILVYHKKAQIAMGYIRSYRAQNRQSGFLQTAPHP